MAPVTRLISGLVAVVAILGGTFLYVTRPSPRPAGYWDELEQPDIANGALVFAAGGCASCHMAPKAQGDQQLVLAGGMALESPFGTFYPPNISPDEISGIGGWSLAEFGDAITRGVGREGQHLYPSLPYVSYVRMNKRDVADLFAYIKTLPKSTNRAPDHALGFPFNVRLALGGWKLLYFNDKINNNLRVDIMERNPNPDALRRGQYLVEGPGHCGECHTPRDALGGLMPDQWLKGAPSPDGAGKVPGITPGNADFASWSEGDIATYLETGITPDFDTVGGAMVHVQQNLAKLPAQDLKAIATYLKALPTN